MATLILFGAMLIVMLLRVALPFGADVAGKPQADVTLTYREKLLLHRINIYAIGAVMLLSAIGGLLTGLFAPLLVLGTFVILTLPHRYRFTTTGVAFNNVVFRRWDEFESFEAREREIRLLPKAGVRSFSVRVLRANQQPALAIIRRHLSPLAREGADRPAGKSLRRSAKDARRAMRRARA